MLLRAEYPPAAGVASIVAIEPGLALVGQEEHIDEQRHRDHRGHVDHEFVHVAAAQAGSSQSEIWFCGPQGLAEKLKQELGRIGQGRFSFHQEAFEMR